MAELAVGNFVEFTSGTATRFKFQNFFIGQSVDDHDFVPFGFSGVTINKTGDGTDASLLFPNSTENVGKLTRSFSQDAIEGKWIAYVRIVLVNPDTEAILSTISQYYGQVASGGWDNANISLQLNSVLDAVGGDIPQRRVNQELVGDIPTTSGVRFQ